MGKFTQQDDAIVIQRIKDNPSNLQLAFEDAGLLLNRSKASISARYYVKLRNSVPMLAMGNDKVMTVNTKYTPQAPDATMFNARRRDETLIDFFNGTPKEALIKFIMGSISLNDKKRMLKRIFKDLVK